MASDGLDDLEEDDEEYDDEEDEDEEEETSSRSKPKKKKQRNAASYYLDEEADVADEDEEEEEGEDMGIIAGEEEDLGDAGASARSAHAHHRMMDSHRTGGAHNRLEAIARKYEERGDDYDDYDDIEDDDDEIEGDDSAISQQSLLPSAKDSKLWMMTCKVGKEREIALTIMQKFIDKETAPDRLLVKSVVCPDHLKGHVYIEADKESHVREAVKGVRELFSWKIKLVPIKEMTDVLTVTKKPIHLEKNSWVRVKRGVYRGDIAQVAEYQESRGRVRVKLIPRLDFAKGTEDKDDPKRKRKIRPPMRFINDDDIKQLQDNDYIEKRRDADTGEVYTLFQNQRFKDGYVYKVLNIKSLDVHDVVPTLDELQKFQENREKDDDADDDGASMRLPINVAPIKGKRKTIFAKGDTVKVVEGDLRHLMGVVESIDEDMVTMMPKHQDLTELLTFPSHQLQKFFKEGDHCKVIAGQYDGETGLIVKVDDNIVTLLSDMSLKEIRVLASDIQECTEVTTGRLELGSYELHDLVQIGSSVGIIVKIERDSFRILDTGGHVQSILLQEMGNKRNNRNATSFDSHRNPVVQNDMVAIADGVHKGRQGSIKHVYRYNAFVYCKEVLENGGIIVVKCSHLNLLGGKKKMNGPMGNNLAPRPMTPMRSPRHQGGDYGGGTPRGGSANRGARTQQGGRTDPLYRQTIIITKGSWKGYLGIVKEITESTARVELHTNCKTINVPKTHLQVANSQRAPSGDAMSHFPPATPSAFTRTPSREDMPSTPMRHATPSRGMETPSRDPFNPAIPNTPRHTGGWDDDGWSANPTTPRSVNTPVPSTPGTPGAYSSYSSSYSYNPSTPLSHTPQTPSSYMQSYERGTPQDSTPHTPFSSTPTPSTPHTPGSALGIPQTPHTPTTPSTPGSALGSHDYGEISTPYSNEYEHPPQTPHAPEEAHAPPMQWQAPRLLAKISGGFKSGMYDSSVGVIQEVLGDQCRVTLPERGNETVTVPNDMLEAISPAKRDRLRVVGGAFNGECGVLIGVYGNDGIVKMDVNLEIKILPMTSLAKLAA